MHRRVSYFPEVARELKVERGRTLARSQALQILFQAEALDLSVDTVLAGDYLISKGPLDAYAVELARGCHDNIDRIDYALKSVSMNWSLYRMPGTDRNLLRLAVYEMRFLTGDAAIDDAVIINEAVEIAKAYGTDESSRFVNGVLGRISRMETLPEPPVEQGEDQVESEDEAQIVSSEVAFDIDAHMESDVETESDADVEESIDTVFDSDDVDGE